MNEASQWIAVWAAGLFSGAALYVSLVEHPARMQCGTVLAVTEFGPSYKRAALMQSILALLGSIGALVAWLAGDGPFWAVGGLLLLFSVPFTLIVIRPTNRCLLDPRSNRLLSVFCDAADQREFGQGCTKLYLSRLRRRH